MAYQDFQKFCNDNKINVSIIISNEPTHTAQQASDVHNVPVSNIVKSLLVKVGTEFKLFLVPGDKRLDLELLKKRFNTSDIRMANAEEVKEITGYSIGGVPPFGHKNKLETFIEDGFDKDIELVAAAGSNNSVFRIKYGFLESIVNR